MTSKTKIVCVAMAAALTFSASAASAQTFSIPVVRNGTSTFTVSPGSGSFLDTFLFQIPAKGRATVSVASTETTRFTNVNFINNKVNFDGTQLAVVSSGVNELRQIVGKVVNTGTSSLVVQGTSQSLGQYTGAITYTIPEPSIWAMLILGMGVAGAAMRVRRRKVVFAM